MSDVEDKNIRGEFDHRMNCAGNIPSQENDCTCGLKWRIMLQTEKEMHNAWRKRAEEAEKDLVLTGTALNGVHIWVNSEFLYKGSGFFQKAEEAIAMLRKRGILV